jgi:hypothetical protein
MNQEIRQKVVTLARELPDELLGEALSFLHNLVEKAQKNHRDNSSTMVWRKTIHPSFDHNTRCYYII